MKWLLSVPLLLLPCSSLAAEPLVVRNFDRPAWDASHGIELAESLRVGGKDQKKIIFGKIVRIACDSKGQLIVADYEKNEIRRFDAEGELIGSVGRGGDAPDEYRYVTAICVDTADNLYVVGAHRVRIYDAAGKFVTDFRDASSGFARCVRALPDGSVLLAEYDRPTNTVLQKYVAKKHELHFGDPFKRDSAYADEMLMYSGGFIDVGSDGMVYYTQMSPYEIRKFDASGDLVMQVFRENDFVTAPHSERKGSTAVFHPFSGATGIFVLPDGKFLNVAGIVGEDGQPERTVLDLFDTEGHLLLSQRLDRVLSPQWYDASGNLYTFDADDLAVVRSRVLVH